MKKKFIRDDYVYIGEMRTGLCTAKVYRDKNAPTGKERERILTDAVKGLLQGFDIDEIANL